MAKDKAGRLSIIHACIKKKKNAYLQINPEAEEWVECSVCVGGFSPL